MMDAPAWVKHFDETNRKDQKQREDEKWTGWGRPPDSDGSKNRALRHIQPYDADYEGESNIRLASSELSLPRIHKVQTDPGISVSEEEKRIKKRRRRRMLEDTSGYSTTSLSEVSELDTSTPRKDRARHSDFYGQNNKQKRDSDVRSEHSRVSRGSYATTRRESEASIRCGSETSRTPQRKDGHHVARSGHRSTTDSVISNTSVHSQRSNQRRPSSSSNVQKYSSPNERKISQAHVDPFDFIQPVPEPFSRRMRKTLGPIMGILLMLILAASLGAAVFFAVELKKTQEDEIQMLRANLALKIKSTTFGRNVDDLSQRDISQLARTYCQQMDFYYRKSQFESTYRGCEVLSIRNDNINFTLFFVEKDASTRDIISVIETSAPRVSNNTQNVAVVDQFEIELESVKIKIKHERTPVGFSKIKSISKPKPKVMTTVMTQLSTTVSTSSSKTSSIIVMTSKPATTTTKVTTTTSLETTTTDIWDDWTTTETIITEEMLLAWDPCSKKDGGFFPHPIECHLYFQCSHKQSILQKCTGNLLFDVEASNCVQDRPGLKCPDPAVAPLQPPDLALKQKIPTDEKTTFAPIATQQTTTQAIRTRPRYPGRPDYPREPCLNAAPGSLHAHPDDCAKFIQCIGGNEGQDLTCATNLVYDPDTKACIFPRNDLICPDILPCLQKSTGYFPHPFNCTLYIQCESGREKTQQCASGLIWDPNVNSCVFGSSCS